MNFILLLDFQLRRIEIEIGELALHEERVGNDRFDV